MVQTVKTQQEMARLRSTASALLLKLDINVLPCDVQFREDVASKSGYTWVVKAGSKKPKGLDKKPKDYNSAERSRILQMLVTGLLYPQKLALPEPVAAAPVPSSPSSKNKKKKKVAKLEPIQTTNLDMVKGDEKDAAYMFVAETPVDCPPAYASITPPVYRSRANTLTSQFDHMRHHRRRSSIADTLKKISEYSMPPPTPTVESLGDMQLGLKSMTTNAARAKTPALDNIVRLFKITADIERNMSELKNEEEKYKGTLNVLKQLYDEECSLIHAHLATLERQKGDLKKEAEDYQCNLNKVVEEYHMGA